MPVSGASGFGVTANGARSFILNYRTRLGRERRYTIGSLPDWGVGAARVEATELKRQIDRGGDPLGEIEAEPRGRPRSPTSATVSRPSYIAAQAAYRRRPCYRQQIAAEILPSARAATKVAAVTHADVDAFAPARSVARGRPMPRQPRARAPARAACSAGDPLGLAHRQSLPRALSATRRHKRRRYLSATELARLTEALERVSATSNRRTSSGCCCSPAPVAAKSLQARWARHRLDAAGVHGASRARPQSRKLQHQRAAVRLRRVRLLGDLRHARCLRAWSGCSPPARWLAPLATYRTPGRRICQGSRTSHGVRVHDLRHTYASSPGQQRACRCRSSANCSATRRRRQRRGMRTCLMIRCERRPSAQAPSLPAHPPPPWCQ